MITIAMTLEELKAVMPKGKSDTEQAEAVVRLGYPAVAPILPQLLGWMMDYNWPVAHVFQPFLVSIGEPLAPHIREILATDDTIWKCWVVGVVGESPALLAALHEEIEELAAMTPKDGDEEWLKEEALEALYPKYPKRDE